MLWINCYFNHNKQNKQTPNHNTTNNWQTLMPIENQWDWFTINNKIKFEFQLNIHTSRKSPFWEQMVGWRIREQMTMKILSRCKRWFGEELESKWWWRYWVVVQDDDNGEGENIT